MSLGRDVDKALAHKAVESAEERAAFATGHDYADRRERLRRLRSLPARQRTALHSLAIDGTDVDTTAKMAGIAVERWRRLLAYPTIRRFLAELQRELAPMRVAVALGALTRAATDQKATPKERVQAAKELVKVGGGDRGLSLAPGRGEGGHATANVQVNLGALPSGPGEVIRAVPGIVVDLRRESMDARHLVEEELEPELEQARAMIDVTPPAKDGRRR